MANQVFTHARPGAALSRTIPFALFIGLIALASFAPSPATPAPGVWDSRWLHALRGPVVAIALAMLWRHYHELRVPRGVSAREWILALLTGGAVFVVWINFDAGWMRIGEGGGFDPTAAGRPDWALLSLRLFALVLVVPVMEELFWRSFLMRWIQHPDFLKVRAGAIGARAFAITAVLFALEHHLWLAGLIAGVAYNWLYVRSENLWVPVAAHAVTNGLLGIYILAYGRWDLW